MVTRDPGGSGWPTSQAMALSAHPEAYCIFYGGHADSAVAKSKSHDVGPFLEISLFSDLGIRVAFQNKLTWYEMLRTLTYTGLQNAKNSHRVISEADHWEKLQF